MFVANRYSDDAFQLLKRNGIIPATPRTLFGEEVAEALAQLSSVLIGMAKWQISPDRIDEILKRLLKIEGAAIQLRGTLLEFMAAGYWRREADNVWMNRILKSQGAEAEADIIAIKDQTSVTFIECKGYNPYATLPDQEAKDWLQKRVPTLYKAAREHPDWRNLPVRFEFWTSAELTSEAMNLLETARATINPKRYSIVIRQGPEILDAFERGRDKTLAIAFRKHFMRQATNGPDVNGDEFVSLLG